jgi:serine/threonine protein kinase
MPAVPRASRIPYGPDDIVLPTKYRLIRRLGRGGFAEVWEAQNSFMDRIDAIKIIFPRFAESGRYTAQQIASEARIPNVLRQRTPHVADVFDAGITDLGLPYIVMELLKGSTLRDRITKRFRENRLTVVKDIVGISFEIVHALAIAHSMKIVHLDVKPENIFLAKQFDQGTETTSVKVLDFGLARLIEQADTGTFEDGLAGTTRYAAPEQFSRAFGTIGTWSDTYAIGHIIFELAVGLPTFESTGPKLDRYALEHAQCTVEPPDVREFRPDVPAALANLIRRCLSKDPRERPQTASELAKALAELDEALRGKRPLVSLAAISDFDLPLDSLKFNTTTQPSPAPATVGLSEPETEQVVHGPSYVSPHSQTEIPGLPSAEQNVSESFFSEPPAAPAAPTAITVTPIVMLVGSPPTTVAEPVEKKTLRLQLPELAKVEVTAPAVVKANGALPAAPSSARVPQHDDKTDPDGPPLFFEDPPPLVIETTQQRSPSHALRSPGSARSSSATPAISPLATGVATAPAAHPLPRTERLVATSALDAEAPPRVQHLPRYRILPGTGPMNRTISPQVSNLSLRGVTRGQAATDDLPPVVPLHRFHSWLAPGAVFTGVVLLGVAGIAVLHFNPSTPAQSLVPPTQAAVSAPSAPARAYEPDATPASAPSSESAGPTVSSRPSATPARATPMARPVMRSPSPSPKPTYPQEPDELKHVMDEP